MVLAAALLTFTLKGCARNIFSMVGKYLFKKVLCRNCGTSGFFPIK